MPVTCTSGGLTWSDNKLQSGAAAIKTTWDAADAAGKLVIALALSTTDAMRSLLPMTYDALGYAGVADLVTAIKLTNGATPTDGVTAFGLLIAAHAFDGVLFSPCTRRSSGGVFREAVVAAPGNGSTTVVDSVVGPGTFSMMGYDEIAEFLAGYWFICSLISGVDAIHEDVSCMDLMSLIFDMQGAGAGWDDIYPVTVTYSQAGCGEFNNRDT